MANSVIDTFVPTLRRTKPSASIYKHPSQPREHLPDGSTTPDADAVAAAAPSGPDGTKSGPKEVDSEANQEWRESLEERIKKLVRFGPTYGDDTEAMISQAKDRAWGHITAEKDGGESCYLMAIKDIEKEVVDCYDDSIVDETRIRLNSKQRWRTEFCKMIARDGCFFLQLSLHILGGWEHLGYRETNPYFGNIDSASWIPDMFFVGNQIPYMVIESLMAQPFFQKVIKDGIKNGTWRRPKDGNLAKLALYQTVVEPQLTTEGKKVADARPPDFSIVTALRNVLLGSNDNPAVMTEFQDLELGYTTDDKPVRFRRASELQRSGVKLINKAGIGISNIWFKNRGYSASLYLPPFHIRTHTIDVLTSLVQYERSLTKADREVTAYISFMRDLAPTYKDFKILQDQGIIQVHERHLTSSVMSSLDGIVRRSTLTLRPTSARSCAGSKNTKLCHGSG